MDREKVLIVTDEAKFSQAITKCWPDDLDTPMFVVEGSGLRRNSLDDTFCVTIVGGLDENVAGLILEKLSKSGKPVIYVSQHLPAFIQGPMFFPEIDGWAHTVVKVASEITHHQLAKAELASLLEKNAKLENQAVLGRYMVEMRHNLNNALTSILGNSELMLLDEDSLPNLARAQVETIRNMGMRLNEIMQRFSSLQKEMQLIEQQSSRKAAKKSATAGA